MTCERFAPYLSASADEIEPAMVAAVADHVATCAACRADTARFAAIRRTLGGISVRDPEPPVDLVPSIIAKTSGQARSGAAAALVPIPPVELARVLQENREVIVQAGAAALVAAGAAWALWRGLRSLTKPRPQRA